MSIKIAVLLALSGLSAILLQKVVRLIVSSATRVRDTDSFSMFRHCSVLSNHRRAFSLITCLPVSVIAPFAEFVLGTLVVRFRDKYPLNSFSSSCSISHLSEGKA